MQINWFTVVAEMLNFLILVWLLKRFLYKPILKAIDERENKIAAQLKDAETKKTEATKEQEEFKKKNDQFDLQRKGLMDKAVSDTNVERDKLLDAARKDAIALRTKLEKAAADAQESRNREIAQKTQEEVLAIARKALAEVASSSLEAQSVQVFLKRLSGATEDERKQFIGAFKVSGSKIVVQSAFELSADQRASIGGAINGILGSTGELQFTTVPGLISGIELSSDGFKLAWSLSEYLNSLEKSMATEAVKKPAEA